MGCDIVQYSAVDVILFSRRWWLGALGDGLALCAARRAGQGSHREVEAAVIARLNGNIHWVVGDLSLLRFEFLENAVDSSPYVLFPGMERSSQWLPCSRVTAKVAVVSVPVVG